MERLKATESKQARIEKELGKTRIEKAYVEWFRMRPKKLQHRGELGEEEIAEIAHKHPEVDREVCSWLSDRVKLWKELNNTCLELGMVVYQAYAGADLAFFKKLCRTLHGWNPTPATGLKDRLYSLAVALDNPLPMTLSELESYLDQVIEDAVDRRYLSRLCKKLGIGLQAGKLGRPPIRKQKT